jgi:Uma2 family endonuclease
MATTPRSRAGREVDYPTSDGKPMAETDVHRDLMVELIQTLEARYAADPRAYVSGNLLLFYEEGNRRRHVSPDVFVVLGVAKKKRDHYLTWLEGQGPDLVIELTSKSTRSEDVKTKMALYRDVLRVPEYFLFDPFEDYLQPPMQGYRLVEGRYDPIEWVAGRLPSEILGLHLERDGIGLRLHDPATGLRLPTLGEVVGTQRLRADQAEAEVAQLRRELEALRGRPPGAG